MNDRTIVSDFFPISDLKSTIRNFIFEKFKFPQEVVDQQIDSFLILLHDDIYCYMEYPYVDKVFRNSYYSFYATKHNSTFRDCARVSFYASNVTLEHFRENKYWEKLMQSYLGFLTIRPTLPNLIGRSFISPNAYKVNNWLGCYTNSNVVINGVRLNTYAFPHSSQDHESISCAETSIWSIMEYFGTKYPEYKPILPSKIIETLSNQSYQRQLPSLGLSAEQISYALKEFGFGTRLYSKDLSSGEIYPEDEFRKLLGYYIESGIPIVAAIENENIGHAIIIIGHTDVNYKTIDLKFHEPIVVESLKGKINLYDYVDFIKDYVVIDDNMPPYNIVSFNDPTKNYNDPEFENCKIKNFIAPLYHKIYLEAGGARELMISYLENFDHEMPGDDIIFKLFYTSSRSFKAELNSKMKLNKDATNVILNITMPKFIWLVIFTSPELIKKSKANGIIIIDATEPNFNDSLILFLSPNKILTYDPYEENKYNIIDVKSESFNIFANNLHKANKNGKS